MSLFSKIFASKKSEEVATTPQYATHIPTDVPMLFECQRKMFRAVYLGYNTFVTEKGDINLNAFEVKPYYTVNPSQRLLTELESLKKGYCSEIKILTLEDL